MEAGLVVPLAPRVQFPAIGSPGCAVICTDAAREDGTGIGGYAPVRRGDDAVFYFIEERWPSDIIIALQENRISMPAGEMFTMVVAMVAFAGVLPGLSHAVCFTDSMATKAVLASGASPAPQLNEMAMWLFDRLPGVQVLSIHQPGKRNDAADGISRADLEKVLLEVRQAGWRHVRVQVPSGAWALARRLLLLPPAVPTPP